MSPEPEEELIENPSGPSDSSPIEFPPELPISSRVADIARAIAEHPVVIVAGATGSGKTTQLPKIALAMGRGTEKIIGVTQPRRLAATSVAARVASELGSPLGTDVGYQVRFDDRTSAQTYVKFMTDGILLAEIEGDALLWRYDTLIIDEAHERSLNIDFLLGWLKRILPERPDLKVVISSATLETDRFSEFFGGAPVIEVAGRTFPVEVLYEPPNEDLDLPDAAAAAVENVTGLDPRGDILVFLPGEREIRDTEIAINRLELRHTVVQPLYARLSASEQARVFSTIPQRRVILATNVAETSVTIPGIVYVIDTGVARMSRYEPRSGVTRLHVEGISQASADQRKGRCGRVRDGICVRLYDEQSFEARPKFTDPEIKRTGLAGVILRMKSLGLGDVDTFPFLDAPQGKSVAEGYRVLEELGAITETRTLTPMGQRLARFPTDPRIGRMILAGAEYNCVRQVLVIAAALGLQDPRERPREHQQKADDLHRRFRDAGSDFVSLLRLWDFVTSAQNKSIGQLRRACKENFLSFLRVREWIEVHRQLADVVRELQLDGDKAQLPKGSGPAPEAPTDALHTALLTGLLSKIGQYNPEQRVYIGAKQTRFSIHPSSALSRKPPAWVMGFELVETSQLFARTVAKIEPEWLSQIAQHLMKCSYREPHWSEKSGRAVIKEHATLFGLTVFKDRSVDYSKVAPTQARLMFLDHALVRGEYKSRGAFQEKNQKLLLEVARLRDKARKSDMLADDDTLLSFFDKRVPADVVDGKTFEAWRAKAEHEEPKTLLLRMADVLAGDGSLSESDYPDTITLHGASLPLRYLFDPSSDEDGITLTIPLVLLPQLQAGELDWIVPGMLLEKVTALLYELPKSFRRELGPAPDVARAVIPKLKPFHGEFAPALSAAIQEATGILVPEEAFRLDAIGTYLRVLCRVVGEGGKVVAESRDPRRIITQHGDKARAAWKAAVPAASHDKKGIVSWDFGDLPEFVLRDVGGSQVRGYPTLVDAGTSVTLTQLESAAAATAATRAGVRRLVMLATRSTLNPFAQRLPQPFTALNGSLPSRADSQQFHAQLLARIVDDAFGLADARTLPRNRAAFEQLTARGTSRLSGAARAHTEAVTLVRQQLDKTLSVMKSAGKHPSGTVALGEIRIQLERIFTPDLLAHISLEQLGHVPRYLRAIDVRLGRAVTDPLKDAGKLAPLAPLWSRFCAGFDSYRDRDAVTELRWDFEELRVAIFAPELKTAWPVSLAGVTSALAVLK
jgi:ATP-dependent helicase HrpA